MGGRVHVGTPYEVALQTSVFTRQAVERVIRFSFELARERKKKLTSVTKSNACQHSMVFWDDVFSEFAAEYPGLVRLQSIGQSHEGRDVWLATVTAFETGEDAEKPALWVDGNIHASELSPSSACLYLLQTLVTGCEHRGRGEVGTGHGHDRCDHVFLTRRSRGRRYSVHVHVRNPGLLGYHLLHEAGVDGVTDGRGCQSGGDHIRISEDDLGTDFNDTTFLAFLNNLSIQ